MVVTKTLYALNSHLFEKNGVKKMVKLVNGTRGIVKKFVDDDSLVIRT